MRRPADRRSSFGAAHVAALGTAHRSVRKTCPSSGDPRMGMEFVESIWYFMIVRF